VIVLSHPTYWPEVRRGAERLVHDLAAGLAAQGQAVRIVTSHEGRTTRTVEDGVEVVRLWRPPHRRLDRRLFEHHVAQMPLLAREYRHAGVVQAFQAPDAAVAAGCDAVTALSEFAGRAFRTWLGVDARVIPPPVDTDAFTPGGEREEHPTIVCAADAREPRKRVGLLREAFALVRREHPRAQLWLDRRTAPDGVDLGDLPDRYRRAWVSVLPSWGEAFGLVLAEALACGTPVVGADRDGIPEVLGGDERVGRLFAGEDPRALATALLEALELARDPATAAACRARAQTFSRARCVERHLALYRQLHEA
jgi:glycosyltransferase involved in cell wall biosynthesis